MKRTASICLWLCVAMFTGAGSTIRAAGLRSETQQKYVASLWSYIEASGYHSWPVVDELHPPGVGPWPGQKTFVRGTLVDRVSPAGTVLISEHWNDGSLSSISVHIKQDAGYSERNRDWYWAHYLTDGTVVSASNDQEAHRQAGFVTWIDDGRLWVFEMQSADAAEFLKSGELAKSVTRPGAGPNGMTIRSSSAEVIDRYLWTRPGFVVAQDDGRLWVFRSDAPELLAFRAGQESEKVVIRPGAGPDGMTLKATDAETLDAYIAAAGLDQKSPVANPEVASAPESAAPVAATESNAAGVDYSRAGFVTQIEDGRLWVFVEGAPEIEELNKNGELAKHVTRPGAGPGGITLKGPDAETLDAYMAGR